MTNAEYLSSIKEMIIYKTKEYATCRVEEQNLDLKKTYSVNNVILLKMHLFSETQLKDTKNIRETQNNWK